MTNPNKRTALDEQLDAALAKYAAVEPRVGLEERVLANLRTQERTTTRVPWWRWAGAVAVALLITILLVWRLQQHSSKQVVRYPANALQKTQTQIANGEMSGKHQQRQVRAAVRRSRKRALPNATQAADEASATPKLDQFPSPQPLSQEELVLARYAMEFPEEATLVARAQDEYEKEVQREMNSTNSGIRPSGLDK